MYTLRSNPAQVPDLASQDPDCINAFVWACHTSSGLAVPVVALHAIPGTQRSGVHVN